MRSRRTRALEFPPMERATIKERDGGCIFCRINYRMPADKEKYSFSLSIMSIMHYISRAKGGLGIKENGAIGCQWHHDMLDNGKDGHREEMLEYFKGYLKLNYPDWEESKLIYQKTLA